MGWVHSYLLHGGMISFDDELLFIMCSAVNAGEHLKPRATKRAKSFTQPVLSFLQPKDLVPVYA